MLNGAQECVLPEGDDLKVCVRSTFSLLRLLHIFPYIWLPYIVWFCYLLLGQTASCLSGLTQGMGYGFKGNA